MRKSAVACLIVAVALGGAAPAWAHVTVTPKEVAKGSSVTLVFKVPNEKDSATTTKVVIAFPDNKLNQVSVPPKVGWTHEETAERVTWTASAGGGIKPGESDQFELSVGALPKDADELVFKALQTYSDGETVSWIDETPASGEEPEHPAPVLKLTGATTNESTATTVKPAAPPKEESIDSETNPLGIAAVVVVAVLALLAALAALLRGRRA